MSDQINQSETSEASVFPAAQSPFGSGDMAATASHDIIRYDSMFEPVAKESIFEGHGQLATQDPSIKQILQGLVSQLTENGDQASANFSDTSFGTEELMALPETNVLLTDSVDLSALF